MIGYEIWQSYFGSDPDDRRPQHPRRDRAAADRRHRTARVPLSTEPGTDGTDPPDARAGCRAGGSEVRVGLRGRPPQAGHLPRSGGGQLRRTRQRARTRAPLAEPGLGVLSAFRCGSPSSVTRAGRWSSCSRQWRSFCSSRAPTSATSCCRARSDGRGKWPCAPPSAPAAVSSPRSFSLKAWCSRWSPARPALRSRTGAHRPSSRSCRGRSPSRDCAMSGINRGVLAFALGVTVLTALVFGSLAAITGRPAAGAARSARVAKRAQAASPGEPPRRSSSAKWRSRLSSSSAPGLILRSFARLLAVDPGFRTANVLTMDVALPADRYGGSRRAACLLRPRVSGARSASWDRARRAPPSSPR